MKPDYFLTYSAALYNLVVLRRTLKMDGIDSNTLLLICSSIITFIAMSYNLEEKVVHQNAQLFDPDFPDEA